MKELQHKKNVLVSCVHASIFSASAFRRRQIEMDVGHVDTVDRTTEERFATSKAETVTSQQEVPYGCFWNHFMGDNCDQNEQESRTGYQVGSITCSTKQMENPLSPSLSAASTQTSLAGGHILDSLSGKGEKDVSHFGKTSAFVVPMNQSACGDLPGEIMISENLQGRSTFRQHASLEMMDDGEGVEVEVSQQQSIPKSNTFESLSSYGTVSPEESETKRSSITTSTTSIPTTLSKALTEVKSSNSKTKGREFSASDEFGEIQQSHTEMTSSTETTAITQVRVRKMGSLTKSEWTTDERSEIIEMRECEIDEMRDNHGHLVCDLAANSDTSTVSEDDFFSEMIGLEQLNNGKERDNNDFEGISKSSGHGIFDEDPFEWAYDIWKRKGLMSGKPKLSPSSDGRKSTKPQARSICMDLSGMNDMPVRTPGKNRLSLPNAPTPAKTGFDLILNRWRQKSQETSVPSFLNSKEGEGGLIAYPNPRSQMGIRNQIIAASQLNQLELKSPRTVKNVRNALLPHQVENGERPQTSKMGLLQRISSIDQGEENPCGTLSIQGSGSSTAQASQTSRLVKQFSKEKHCEEKMKSRPAFMRSLPKSTLNFKTAVQTFLEDESAIDQVRNRSRVERIRTGIDIQQDLKVARIELKNHSHLTADDTIEDDAPHSTVPPTREFSTDNPRDLSANSDLPAIAEKTYDDGSTHQNPAHQLRKSHLADDNFPRCGESCLVNDSLATRLTFGQHISSDSPWKALLKLDEDSLVETSPKKHDASHPWNRDVAIHKTCKQPLALRDSEDTPCSCSSSAFSGKDDMTNFMLPLMGMACHCGKSSTSLRSPEEPTSLENILRPWQCDFLAAFGIFRGDQLVKAHHHSARALASALRRYRKKHGMKTYPIETCSMALSIWSKTSKAFVRSIRKQITTGFVGELKVPNTLYILSSFLDQKSVEVGSTICDTSALSQEGIVAPSSEDFAEL